MRDKLSSLKKHLNEQKLLPDRDRIGQFFYKEG
jgi:hypothetical protein